MINRITKHGGNRAAYAYRRWSGVRETQPNSIMILMRDHSSCRLIT